MLFLIKQLKSSYHSVIVILLSIFLLVVVESCTGDEPTKVPLTIRSGSTATASSSSQSTSSVEPSYLIFRHKSGLKYYRYDLLHDQLDELVDPTDSSGMINSYTAALISPDRHKLAVFTSITTSSLQKDQVTLWVRDLTQASTKLLIDLPFTADFFAIYWNDAATGIVYLDYSKNGIYILDLEKGIPERIGGLELCGETLTSKRLDSIQLSWSTSRGEITCLHPVEAGIYTKTSYDSLIVTDINSKFFHTFKFTGPITTTYNINFSPSADYLNLAKQVYSLQTLSKTFTNQGDLANFQPDYTQHLSGLLCPARLNWDKVSPCPLWSTSGRYILYD